MSPQYKHDVHIGMLERVQLQRVYWVCFLPFFDNLGDVKMNKKLVRVVQDPVSFLNGRDTFTCLPNGHRKPASDCCVCCTNTKAEKSAIEPICCGCFTAKGAHIWPAWALPHSSSKLLKWSWSCSTTTVNWRSLKFEWKVLFSSRASRDYSVAKPRSLLTSTHGRGLFSPVSEHQEKSLC